ncbi:SelB domain-containing protein, partial [Craurococcus roseus]|uniref:SelB domain-containing protein n=1 Tax=Craurococcus roseus TaxID=77585 RepID=UPI0031D377E4
AERGRVFRRFHRLDAARLLPEADRALVASLEAAYRGAGLSPPDARTATAGQDPRRAAGALRLLLRAGVLRRAVHAGREVLFHREALGRACAALRAALAARPEGLTVSECDALLGISRRHGVPLLELLDAEGFTRRDGDRRHLAEAPSVAPAEAFS